MSEASMKGHVSCDFLHVDLLTDTETLCSLYQYSALTVLILKGRGGKSYDTNTRAREIGRDRE